MRRNPRTGLVWISALQMRCWKIPLKAGRGWYINQDAMCIDRRRLKRAMRRAGV